MSKQIKTLGIELRFWPNKHAAVWEALLVALWSWDPALCPQVFQVTIGEEMLLPGERSWEESRVDGLARLCAGQAEFAWILGGKPDHYMSCEGRGGRISIGIQIPAPKQPVANCYIDLLHALSDTLLPALGMLFHYEDLNASFDRQGLRGLSDIPPLLYLGADAVAQLGGREKLRQAPCEVRETSGGGLLFIVRADPFGKSSKKDHVLTAAVSKFLGISAETPLILTAT